MKNANTIVLAFEIQLMSLSGINHQFVLAD